MCLCPVGTATKGVAHWYYHVQLLLSSSFFVSLVCALESSVYCRFFRDIAGTICDITQHILASTPSLHHLPCVLESSMDKLLFQRLFIIVGIASLNSWIHPPSASA